MHNTGAKNLCLGVVDYPLLTCMLFACVFFYLGNYILFDNWWKEPEIQDFHYQLLLHCKYVHVKMKNLNLNGLVFCSIYIPKILWNRFQ